MKVAPKRPKPNMLRMQRENARREITASGIKPPPSTFPRERLPYVEALPLAGEKAEPLIRKILENLSLVEISTWIDLSKAASALYAKQGNFKALQELACHRETSIRAGAAHGLALCGKKGLPLLMVLLKDISPTVKEEAVAGISKIFSGPTGINKLAELAKIGDKDVAIAVARELGKRGEAAIPTLLEIMRSGEFACKGAAARALLKIGPKGIEALEKLIVSEDWVTRKYAAEALANYYFEKKDLKSLAVMAEKGDDQVRRYAEEALSALNARELLLLTRRPFAATPYLREILKDIRSLREASSQLKKEFGGSFIGIVILGSIAKGYALSRGDVDYALIASDPLVEKRLKEIAKERGINLCRQGYFINPKSEQNKTIAPLFCGLFLGDRKAMIEAQRQAFMKFANSPEKWEKIRLEIFEHELKIEKSFSRLRAKNFSEEKRRKIAAALRVPPPYEQMKKILGIS
ncbi:MAG: HEAT repeat domain-containing protein [Candidatus Diapherotrites archaeon]